MSSTRRRKLRTAAIFLLCLLPLLSLGTDLVRDALGANPVEAMLHRTGGWALRLLLISLAVTPARRLFGWTWLVRHRRMLGLFAFAYAILHGAIYVVFDQSLDPGALAEDVLERLYITAGFGALLLLTPLAVTSTRGWQRRLGRRWLQLHRLVYPAGVLAVVHLWWQVKGEAEAYLEAGIYAGALALLLGIRLFFYAARRHRRRARLKEGS